jgi:hypothetical protein
MKKPKVGELYSFRVEQTAFSGLVNQLHRDRNCLPYGVVIELLSKEKPTKDAQCWLEGKNGEQLGGVIEEVSKAADNYKLKLVAIIPYKDFWE